jgi:PelA/Pel-15E family pectate lyase
LLNISERDDEMKKLITSALLSAVFLFNTTAAFAAEKTDLANITDYANELKLAGIAGNNMNYDGTTTSSSIDIESVKTLGEHCLIVTLGSYFPDFNVADISLKAYTSDWYNLKANLLDRISYDKYAITTNGEGKTVIVFYINETINNNVLEDSYDDETTLTDAEKTAAITTADNEITWQLDNGGWYKAYDLHKSRAWDGKEDKNITSSGGKGWSAADGTPCGTIDNDATYSEMEDIALAYALTNDSKYKESFEKGLAFLKLLQYPTGGFAQVYPSRGANSYSDYVTLNDDAMANVLIMLEKVKDERYPFNTGIISEKSKTEIETMINDATDYLIKAQIVCNGTLSAWCAQHDPVTYEPRPARAYELESISGSESIGVIKFLMHQQDNPDAIKAAEAAISWFDSVKLENKAYNNKTEPYIYDKAGSNLWYRFYDYETGVGFYSDRPTNGEEYGGKFYDLSEISEERRTGYAWMGTWPQKIITAYNTYGYYPNRIVVSVSGTSSKDVNGKTLTKGFSLSPTEDNIEEDIKNVNLGGLWGDNILYGDADENNIVDSNDASTILEYSLNNDSRVASEDWLKKCDVDGISGITANDASMVLQKSLNADFEFPIEK